MIVFEILSKANVYTQVLRNTSSTIQNDFKNKFRFVEIH